jgi:copper(I)-binding protein
MKRVLVPALAALCLSAAAAAPTLVRVDDAWVRATVPEQKTTGAYMAITSPRGGRLVGASSPIAAAVEVHEMKMEGDVMRMRAIAALPLPAGQRVELKPGAFHMMMLGLKQPVKAGDIVPLKLVVEADDGKREEVDVRAVAKGAN